jgi:hypothetical protein
MACSFHTGIACHSYVIDFVYTLLMRLLITPPINRIIFGIAFLKKYFYSKLPRRPQEFLVYRLLDAGKRKPSKLITY